jgi:hypothetical protein
MLKAKQQIGAMGMRIIEATRTTKIQWALGLFAALIIPATAFADVLHFYDGQLLRGDVKRVTGDIIEFKQQGMFGSRENIARLRLSNRHDIVETLTGTRHYGEIFYVDKFKIELKAASGMVHINRLKVKNIVMGTPMQQPELPNTPSAFPTQPLGMNNQQSGSTGMNSAIYSSTASTSSATEQAPALRGPTPQDEDVDAIPPIDRAP